MTSDPIAGMSSETLHVSTVAIGDRAVLLEGRSGSGKSDLALRLIDRGATLVSDDYTILTRRDGALLARAPDTISGRIEVRGLGIVAMPYIRDVPASLLVRLGGIVERFPLDGDDRIIAGIRVRAITLDPFEASAPIKIELAVKQQIS